MKVYTYFEARQSLASILDEAYREGRLESAAKMDVCLSCGLSLPRDLRWT